MFGTCKLTSVPVIKLTIAWFIKLFMMLIKILTQLKGFGIVKRVPLMKAVIGDPLVFNTAPTYLPIKFGIHDITEANEPKNKSPKFVAVK